MNKIKYVLIFLNFIISTMGYAQGNNDKVLEAEFTYLLKAKIDKSLPSYIYEEVFLLQVIQDKAFFISENLVKTDSSRRSDVFRAMVEAPKGGSIHIVASSRPKIKFYYTIVQSNQEVGYFENIDTQLYSYQEPVIKDWKLSEETQTVNTLHCKKATLQYKGRNWTAWYAPEIPLPYGPYKFTGLPGLIIKMESEDGEFSFQLVESIPKNKLNGKELSVEDRRYKKKSKSATFSEMRKMKKNEIDKMIAELSNMGVQLSDGKMKNIRELQKQRLRNFNNENLIEKTED